MEVKTFHVVVECTTSGKQHVLQRTWSLSCYEGQCFIVCYTFWDSQL